MIKKQLSSSAPRRSEEDIDREFLMLKEALLRKTDFLQELLQQRFSSPKPWKFQTADLVLVEKGVTIDLVFSLPDPEDKRFILVDLSVPYLQKGQKFTLDTKARQFQKEQGIALSRIKKAIFLIRRESETIGKPPARLHCPIIEIELNQIMGTTTPVQPEAEAAPPPAPAEPQVFSEDLLGALRQSIVQECLTTMHKRKNKYIRKGLWRWIEREIMDPNVHFFLVILSSIYQGKTSEVLSRRFKNIDDYANSVDPLLEALFSEETGLAPEIVKSMDRHKKALRKFFECFLQTPPFEYLRSLFLKEFRTTRDGAKARMAVFDTLKELLTRCGFQGEKETQYPLEILDELAIFQGLIMGDYSQLRVENATKKLKHLVPGKEWEPAEIYRLRDELARVLNLPGNEFNLNAFLPQAFCSPSVPGKISGRGRSAPREAFQQGENRVSHARQPSLPIPSLEPNQPLSTKPPSIHAPELPTTNNTEPTQALPHHPFHEDQPGTPISGNGESFSPPLRPPQASVSGTPPLRPPQASVSGTRPSGSGNWAAETPDGPPQSTSPRKFPPAETRPPDAGLLSQPPRKVSPSVALSGDSRNPTENPVRTSAPPPLPAHPPASSHVPAREEASMPPSTPTPSQHPTPPGGTHGGAHSFQPRNPPPQSPARPPQNFRPPTPELDESRHRFFENFGGHIEEEEEAIRFALDMARNRPEAAVIKTKPADEESALDLDRDLPPSKTPQGPSRTQMPRNPRNFDVPPSRSGQGPKNRNPRRRSGKPKFRSRPPSHNNPGFPQ